MIIGTEEEFYAALSSAPEAVMGGNSVADKNELEDALSGYAAAKTGALLVVKRGDRGVTLYHDTRRESVAGFPVPIVNTVGAGDGFASGLIYGWAQGWDWNQAARFANACGAIVVSRHGCARALPALQEVESFYAAAGKLERSTYEPSSEVELR